jgi:cell division septal protein FtsQ
MFNTDEQDSNSYYREAVKDAVINNTNPKRGYGILFLAMNLFFLAIVSYFGYNYLQESGTNTLKETKVMGITHTSHDNIMAKDDIDYAAEIEKLDNPTTDTEYSTQLKNYVEKEIKKDI